MRRPLYAHGPGSPYDQPPDTDPEPVECTNCSRIEPCDCGTEPDRDDAREAEEVGR